jgi:carboxymethylenebutenolidase
MSDIQTSHFSLSVMHGKESVTVDVYEARPPVSPRGGLLIVQEIFGVTEHIRSVADRYAALGFVAWAPAFFDPVEKGTILPLNADGMKKGIELATQLGWEWPLETVRAAAAHWSKTAPGSPLGLIGYCWGGSLAWLTATRIGAGTSASTIMKATVGYYGSKSPEFKNEKPQIPVMLHFGEKDAHITMDKVRALMDAQPQVPIELYNADHGFNRDGSPSYDADSAKLAIDKTLAFLVRNGF